MKGNIFITGINRGLGKELFEQFVASGYHVFGVLRNEVEYEKLKRKFAKNVKLILTDLSNDEAIEEIQKIVGKLPINLLINNAGIGGKSHLIEDIESEEINELFNIHCLGVFRTIKALKENLLNSEKPIVININSRLGSITRQNLGMYDEITVSYSYRIAKAAQNMLTTCLRKEFGGRILILSIHPGKMKTEIGQVDANVEPNEIAEKFVSYYENDKFQEENGIIELKEEIIEW